MPISRTNLHDLRVVDQIRTTLLQTQTQLVRNALTHKSMAQAQSPGVGTLGTFVTDSAIQHIAHLQWIIDLRSDPTRKQRMLDILAKMGWAESDIVSVVTSLRAAAIALRDSQKTTYVQIIAACDAVLAAVDAPDSLWPE